MYEFRDTTNHQTIANPLPAEAVAIDGQYIENVIDGYKTLYTKGRESLGAELETYSVASANGERLKSRRYPARNIIVGFQLIADTNEDFRQKFTHLNNLLSMEQADFVFADEDDKFFTGSPIMDAEVEAGRNSVKGEWHIYCTYPFKRSVEVKRLTMEDAEVSGNTASFGIDYLGDQPARPVLRAKFAPTSGATYSEDGDCGFVAFVDDDAHIIQLGNPSIIDSSEGMPSVSIINQNFTTISGWQTSGGSVLGNPYVTGTTSIGQIYDSYWNHGQGQDLTCAIPSYGTHSNEHGAILWKTIADDDVRDFELNLVHKFCARSASQAGTFYCLLQDASNNVVAGLKFSQPSNSLNTTIDLYVMGQQAITFGKYITIDGSEYSAYGKSKRTPVYDRNKVRQILQEGGRKSDTRNAIRFYKYENAESLTSIVKKGDTVSFKISGWHGWGKIKTTNRTPIRRVTLFFGAIGDNAPLYANAVASLSLSKIVADSFADIPNVFSAGDVVEADCSSASVWLYRNGSSGGFSAPEYGALGNDWENFTLKSGANAIQVIWSEWVDPNYIPEIEIDYNEVFI